MALSFNDIYEQVKSDDGPAPLLANSVTDYAAGMLSFLSGMKADGIGLYDLLDSMTDMLEEFNNEQIDQ